MESGFTKINIVKELIENGKSEGEKLSNEPECDETKRVFNTQFEKEKNVKQEEKKEREEKKSKKIKKKVKKKKIELNSMKRKVHLPPDVRYGHTQTSQAKRRRIDISAKDSDMCEDEYSNEDNEDNYRVYGDYGNYEDDDDNYDDNYDDYSDDTIEEFPNEILNFKLHNRNRKVNNDKSEKELERAQLVKEYLKYLELKENRMTKHSHAQYIRPCNVKWLTY